jgi:hypothetical protein
MTMMLPPTTEHPLHSATMVLIDSAEQHALLSGAEAAYLRAAAYAVLEDDADAGKNVPSESYRRLGLRVLAAARTGWEPDSDALAVDPPAPPDGGGSVTYFSVHFDLDEKSVIKVGPVHPELPENRISIDGRVLIWLDREGGERLLAAVREALDGIPSVDVTPADDPAVAP